jgi:hypothetical protein
MRSARHDATNVACMVSRQAERIEDARTLIECHAVLHVLRPEPLATGLQRGSQNHRVIDGHPIAFGKRQTGVVGGDGHWRTLSSPRSTASKACVSIFVAFRKRHHADNRGGKAHRKAVAPFGDPRGGSSVCGYTCEKNISKSCVRQACLRSLGLTQAGQGGNRLPPNSKPPGAPTHRITKVVP